jgi:hypothetical protein
MFGFSAQSLKLERALLRDCQNIRVEKACVRPAHHLSFGSWAGDASLLRRFLHFIARNSSIDKPLGD